MAPPFNNLNHNFACSFSLSAVSWNIAAICSYPSFFAWLAKNVYLFEEVGKIEKEHEERYLKLLENVKEGKVFEAGEVKIWKCRNCGHIVVGTSAPEVCPVCNHPKAFFEIKAENY